MRKARTSRSLGAARRRLPAEWEPQDAVLVCWPHRSTDWGPTLEAVEPAFAAIVREISRDETVLLIARPNTGAREKLKQAGATMANIRFYSCGSDDTWARDFGPITILEGTRPVLLDFEFNGWGRKFPAQQDNRLTRALHAMGAFGACECRSLAFILEGGSIESDGQGTILTTVNCLTSAWRNANLSGLEIEKFMCAQLGAQRVLWLSYGGLEGDDTDAHIDTMVRFAPHSTILYVACDDPKDSHYRDLHAMAREIRAFRTLGGRPYRLQALPWPRASRDGKGQRLPLTYANFLVTNHAVLVPVYNDPCDAAALAIIGKAFPGRRIVAIDSSALILQHGAVHCLTMQIPQGVIRGNRGGSLSGGSRK